LPSSFSYVSHYCPCLALFQHLLISTVVNVLLHIYAVHAWPNSESTDQNGPKYTNLNGNANGHARSTSQQIQDAEAFELHGLISDDEEGPSMGPRKNSDEELGKDESRH
jgi:hypothetical protein